MVLSSDYEIKGSLKEDLIVTSSAHLVIRGMTSGTLQLRDGSACTLYGIHSGDVIIDSSCSLESRGILNGNIINKGTIHIWGIVNAPHISGKTVTVHEGAILNSVTYSSDAELIVDGNV